MWSYENAPRLFKGCFGHAQSCIKEGSIADILLRNLEKINPVKTSKNVKTEKSKKKVLPVFIYAACIYSIFKF